MTKLMKILMLEDDDDDVELIQQVIKKGKIVCTFSVTSERNSFLNALESFNPDIVISDNSLPQFDATEALELTRKFSLHLPFILVTGTVSEEFAANIIRMGADDYIIKDRMTRLPSAINAAILKRQAETNLINERKKAEQEILSINRELRNLTNHLQHIREQESIRISREIHDQLGQQLTVMKIDASWILKNTGDVKINEKARGLTEMIDEMIMTVRKIAADLRPSLLDDMGLGPALEFQLGEFGKKSGLTVTTTGTDEILNLEENIKTGLFRIVQELLTNIARHADASHVSLALVQEPKHVKVEVSDNGKGFDVSEIKNKNTFGILGVKERVAMMNGSYNIISRIGQGTTVTLNVPVN
jgi:signal transduction histidine kinase